MAILHRIKHFGRMIVLGTLVALASPFTLHAQCPAPAPGPGGAGLPPCIRPIRPQVSCITANQDGTYTASWGYVSDNNTCCPPYELPIREMGTPDDPRANFFSPAPIDRGQPSFFIPGAQPETFDITWDGTPLTWTLRYFTPTPPFFAEESVTASIDDSTQLCPPPPPPPCNLNPSANAVCGGTQTNVDLEVNAGISDPYDYQWTISCDDSGAQFTGLTTQTPQITLFTPGLGVSANCTAEVVVNNQGVTSSCSTEVDVTPCNVDCLGQIDGTAMFDLCGVCNGSNACVDCLGQPFGNAQPDRCGVCEGDGDSCLGCSDTVIVEQQFALDSNAMQQADLVDNALYRYRKLARKNARVKSFIRSVRKEADMLSVEIWVLTWSLPQTITSCTNTLFCASFDNTFLLSDVSNKSARLLELTNLVAKRITRLATTQKQVRIAKRIVKEAETLHTANLGYIQEVPPNTSSCVN